MERTIEMMGLIRIIYGINTLCNSRERPIRVKYYLIRASSSAGH